MDQREYYRFMGYPAEVLRERYLPYVERFAPGTTVVDIGCGRGEFLELLRDRGIEGIGVDPDAGMVDDVREKGLQAVQADGLSYLREHPRGCEGVFMSHVAEHLRADDLAAMIKASAEALKPGGRLLVVTPNPHNLLMQLQDFWIDLQHVRFYSPHALHLLLRSSGLVNCELGINPLYRLGPDWAVDGLPPLRGRIQPEPPRTGVRRVAHGERIPESALRRLDQLESRIDLLSAWVSGLYPPGEFYATGLRPEDRRRARPEAPSA